MKLRRVRPEVEPPRFEWPRRRGMPLESLVIENDFLDDPEALAALSSMPNLRRLELRESAREPGLAALEARLAALAAALPRVDVSLRAIDRIEYVDSQNGLRE